RMGQLPVGETTTVRRVLPRASRRAKEMGLPARQANVAFKHSARRRDKAADHVFDAAYGAVLQSLAYLRHARKIVITVGHHQSEPITAAFICVFISWALVRAGPAVCIAHLWLVRPMFPRVAVRIDDHAASSAVSRPQSTFGSGGGTAATSERVYACRGAWMT